MRLIGAAERGVQLMVQRASSRSVWYNASSFKSGAVSELFERAVEGLNRVWHCFNYSTIAIWMRMRKMCCVGRKMKTSTIAGILKQSGNISTANWHSFNFAEWISQWQPSNFSEKGEWLVSTLSHNPLGSVELKKFLHI